MDEKPPLTWGFSFALSSARHPRYAQSGMQRLNRRDLRGMRRPRLLPMTCRSTVLRHTTGTPIPVVAGPIPRMTADGSHSLVKSAQADRRSPVASAVQRSR